MRFIFAAVCAKAGKFAFGRYPAVAIYFLFWVDKFSFWRRDKSGFNRFAPGRAKSGFKFTKIS